MTSGKTRRPERPQQEVFTLEQANGYANRRPLAGLQRAAQRLQ
jgi:hypothetical protein